MELLKPYLSMILGGILLAAFAFMGIKLYWVQHQFNSYKENINEQLRKNELEKARIEAEHLDKYKVAQTGYTGAIDELTRRLRAAEIMSRNSRVRMAGNGGDSVPNETGDSFRPTTALAVGGGICDSDFYAKAIREHVQCHYLLELVK